MFNGRKKINEDKTKVSKGRAETGNNWKMDPIPSLRPSSGLLDMLAEVASQTLHSDPTVKTSPAKKKVVERATREPREKPEPKETVKRKAGKKAEVDTLTAAKLRSLSLSQQLRLCSRLDGDEMRRTFTYTCLLEPELCGQTFSSFGSEGRARQMMRTHLQEHLKNHGPDEPIRVSRRRRTPKVQNAKKKVTSAKVKVEPVKASRLRYSELYDEMNNLPVNNKENKVESQGDWKASSDRSQSKVQTLNLLKIVDIPAPSPPPQPAQQIQTIVPVQQAPVDSDEDTVSCCSTGSRYGDLPPGSPSNGDHALANGDENENEAECDKSIYTEHSYTSRGTENSNGSIINSVYSNEVSRIFIKTEPGLDSPQDSPEVFVEPINKRIPSVGREIDVRTEPAVKTIKSAAKLKDILKTIISKLKEDLPVLCDNRRDVSSLELNGRDTRELTWETTAVERDEFHQHKKPKGKAKFIGQSKAEKEMAIRLINAIKTKGSPAGLQSLDTLECRICRPPRCFTAPTTLMSHYRSHAGIKPYECRICRAAFTRQHSLNYHMLIHSNQTRFTCHDCGRKFRHPSHFKEHRRRHTGESPFECSDCLLRFKTRNTYKRHLKTRHGKVLTTSGGLIILSEEEFKRVRTMPRSPLSHQPSRNGGSGKSVGGDDSDEEEEEEDDYSSSGAEDMSDKLDSGMPQLKGEIVEEVELTVENCLQEDFPECVVTEETDSNTLNFNDIVREAILQSEISFVDNGRKGSSEDSEGADWSVKEISATEESNDSSFATAVAAIANSNTPKVQVLPASGSTKRVTSVEIVQDPPSKTKKKKNNNQDSTVGNSDNLATILSGQNSNAAIPQSLALLQSRYLVGNNKPALSVIGSDSQQATVLLLANQNLIKRQTKNDTISLMLA